MQHIPHLLWIKPFGKRCRADEVDEHHRDVPAFSLVDRRQQRRRPLGDFGHRHLFQVERPDIYGRDRFQQALAVAQREAEFLQVLLAEIRQNIPIDPTGGEGHAVRAKAELRQPLPKIARRLRARHARPAIPTAAVPSERRHSAGPWRAWPNRSSTRG
jgi:hypothetical protein